jgi:ERCC4-type nuclease
VTAEKLIKKFGSVKQLEVATEDELKDVVGPKIAKAIKEFFKSDDEATES